MKRQSLSSLVLLTALSAVASAASKSDETAQLGFVTSTKYARPFSSIETDNARKWLLGPTGIFAYGPYGSACYVLHHREYTKDRNWFVVLSTIPDAPAAGRVFPDDVITGANGKPFPEDQDARVHLGRAIIDSQARDGVLRLSINRKGKDLDVDIPLTPIGGFSPTWPFDCPRTDRMVTDACRYLQEEQLPDGFIPADEANIGTTQGGLLLLATGEPQYLENARRAAYWFVDHITEKEAEGKPVPWGPWCNSYGCLLLAEYYEMTGDRGILPGLELGARQIARGQLPSGGWGHGFFNGYSAGYGEMNNCGITCYMALVLAKECGVPVDEAALAKARAYFGAFGPAVTSQYGDHDLQVTGYAARNGHIGELATVHRLDGNTEFAEAYALKVARAFDRIENGHTGCFMSIVWSPIAASLAPAKEYRRAMDQFDWYYALSQGPRGGFYCQPGGDNLPRTGGEYSVVGQNMSTGGFGLALTVPRRHLRILGAPKSVFVRDLPEPLKAARKLHQTHQWDACIAAVDAFLKDGSVDADTRRSANELRDKARYVQAGVTGTLARIEKMLQVKNQKLDVRAYEIKHMLRPLQGLLGADDPRLRAIAERLPYEDSTVYQKGKAYYEACSTLKYQRMELWFPYGRFARRNSRWMVVVPRDEWTGIYDTDTATEPPRFFALGDGDARPADWQAREFDDGQWPAEMPRGKKGAFSTGLMRIPFTLSATDLFGLRLVVDPKPAIQTGAKVYLNGELVLKCNSHLQRAATFLPSTVTLLKPGRNVIAIEMPYMNRVPRMQLEAKLLGGGSSFAWTPVPGRDAEIRTLRSARLMPQAYYKPKQDRRTVKELMAAFHHEPSFMPELYCALERFNEVVPRENRAAHIRELLESPAWGGRMIGLMVLGEGVIEPDARKIGGLPRDERDAVLAAFHKLRPTYDPFREKAEALLNDPHPLVRVMAARAVGGYGEAAREAIPTLTKLLADTENQHWWIRESAYLAMKKMSLDKDTNRKITLIALRDPSASVRRHPLSETARLKDPDERRKAMLEYQGAMIDQVFDAPLGMWTSKTRQTIAPKLEVFGKDALRPQIPRFMDALKDAKGPRLEGCSELLAWFGGEVIDRVDALVDSEEPVVRVNAINVLVRMATAEAPNGEVVERVTRRLEPLQQAEDVAVSRAAKEGLAKIAARDNDKN